MSDSKHWRRRAWWPASFLPLALLVLLCENGRNSASVILPPRLLPPVRQANGAWRVAWSSENGRTYLLQRTANDALSATNWVDLAVVIGSGSNTFYDDYSAAGQRFYRALAQGDDAFRFIAPPARQVDGAWQLSWTSKATHAYTLQKAVSDNLGSNDWADVATVVATGSVTSYNDPDTASHRFYRVKLADAPAVPVSLGDSDRFLALGTNGLPTLKNGVLSPFEFHPGGRSAYGSGSGFYLRFPNGATILTNNGQEEFQFTNVLAGFSSNYPLQLAAPLAWSGSSPRQAPSASLDYGTVCQIFGLDPSQGIDLLFFGKTPLTWLAGVVEDDGIRGGRFGLKQLASLPLPRSSGAYPDFTLDFTRKDGIRIPFSGSFSLPDGSSFPATLTIPAQRPLWLTIKASGQIALDGRADLIFSNGPSFSADFGFDDPFYHLKMVASGVHVPAIGSLSTLLPNNPSNCIPAGASSNLLNQAAQCLRNFDLAYLNFSASAVGAAIASNAVSAPSAPPDPVTLGVSVLQAWIGSAAAAQPLPFAGLSDLLAQSSDAAVGAQDLETICDYYQSLLQAKAARATNAFQGDPGAEAALSDGLAKIVTALAARADQPDAVINLKNMTAAAQCLLQCQAFLQQMGSPLDQTLQQALTRLMQRFTAGYVAGLGVTNGAFTLAADSTIAGMNRFVALETLRDLVQLRADAQLLGIDSQINAPVDEAMSQLALRLWDGLQSDLNAAEAANDYPGFSYALGDTLDLVALEQFGVFPNDPALSGLPDDASLDSLAARLGNVFSADSTRASGDRSLENQAAEIRRLLGILRQLPASVTYASPPFQRAYDRLETALATGMATLSAQGRLPALVSLLEAGMLQAQLRDQFELTSPVDWETERLPLVLGRLLNVAAQKGGWSEIHQAAQLALAEAARLSTNGDQSGRLLYLQTAAGLLQWAHDIAVALWQDESARRSANPALYVADLLLPGDIHVDKVAGSVRYDRMSGALAGAFSGQMSLPKFNLSLTVNNASFTSGGAFDLNAYGQVGLGLPGNSLGTVSVLGRRPFHVSYQPPNHLALSGSGRLALNNGMSFEGYASLDDPIYQFGMAASGIRLSLATNVFGYVPVLDTNAITKLGPNLNSALNDYFGALCATAEPLSSFTNPPSFAPVGSPPDFEDSVVVLNTDGLNTALNIALLGALAPAAIGYQTYQAAVPALSNAVQQAGAEFDRVRQDLANARAQMTAAVGDTRAQARAALINKLRQASASLLTVATASSNVVRHQLAGDLPNNPSLDPGKSTSAANANDEVKRGLATAASETLPPRVIVETELGLAASILDYEGAQQALGGGNSDIAAILQTYVQNARNRLYPIYGMDPGGNVTNVDAFNALTEEQLQEGLQLSAQLASVAQSADDPDASAVLATVARAMLTRQVEITAQKIQAAAAAKYPAPALGRDDVDGLRQEALAPLIQHSGGLLAQMQLFGVDDATLPAGYDGSGGPVNAANEFARLLDGLSDTYGKRGDALDTSSPNYDRAYQAIVLQRSLEDQLAKLGISAQKKILDQAAARPNAPTSVISLALGRTAALAKQQLSPVKQWAASGANFGVAKTEFIARALCDMAKVFETADQPASTPGKTHAPDDFATELAALQVQIIPAFTLRVTALASAQKAWWVLGRATSSFLDGIAQKATNDLSVAEQAAFNAAQQTLGATAGVAAILRDDIKLRNKPIDLPLPGAIVVNRVYGDVFYNRATGFLRGSFGGRLEFPNLQNAFFDIQNATLDSDLNFSIAAATSGPLPFNGVSVTANVTASGGLNAPLDFSGAGTLSITNGPQFAVTLNFDTATESLSFNSQAGNLQSLRFTDDLALFNAGLGFTVRSNLQSGELRASGAAGFFAKGALPATNAPLSRTNFYLFATNVQAALDYSPGRVDLTFSNATLFLPAFFYPTNITNLCPGTGPATGPTIALNSASPITAAFLIGPPPSVHFSGELDFRQFAFAPPDLPGLAAAVCSAKLKFSDTILPYLTNVTGSLQIPLPNQTNFVDLTNGVFDLTGYPSGRVDLRDDLTLLNLNGFQFILLGQTNPVCGFGSGLTVFPSSAFGQLPSFRLEGGLRVVAPAQMLTGATNDAATGLACGSLSVTPGQLPDFQISGLQFGGTFHLGSGGPVISNALISFLGLTNLFRLDNNHTFVLALDGVLQIPNGPAFTLQQARFTFFDPARLPRFSVASLGVNNQNFTLLSYLPAQVTAAQFKLLNPNADLPYALAPTNIALTVSAQIRFPATGAPMLLGAVNGLAVDFDAYGIPRIKNIDGFDMAVGGLNLPPIKELGGRLHVGGLSSGDPDSIYMVGRLGGSYQGYTLVGQFGANYTGPLGFCLDVNAGAAGIPVGPSGILITGASGGESFVNNNGDPCAFTTYFSKDTNGNLVAPSGVAPPTLGMSWAACRDVVERMLAEEQVFASHVAGLANAGPFQNPRKTGNSSTSNLPCPGDCPPATVDIFCQPHPDQAQFPGKIIAKFSSINEATLNQLGFTEASVAALGSDLAVVAAAAAHAVRTNIANLTPPPDAALLGPDAAAALGAVITNALDSLESSFSNACYQALGSPQAGESFYDVIRRLAYAGLPCPDVTMSAACNVSYAGVSSVAYVSGKAVLSTAGAGGVIGAIYVIGVPLGEARVFVAVTDAQGNPNPSLCGQAAVGFGPLDLGDLRISYACPGCVTGVLSGVPAVLGALSDTVLNHITAQVAPGFAALNLGRSQLISALLGLSATQQLALLAQLANQAADDLPLDLPQVFFQGVASEYDSINPVFVACGQVKPKIFGLPLGDALVSARLFATKAEESGGVDFSPSVLLGAYLPILPGSDTASLSFSYTVGDPYGLLFAGLAGGFAPDNIAAFTQSAIDSALQNTSFGISYAIHPFGLTMAQAAARVILPDLTTHPVLPWSTWVRPEERGNTNLPSRHDLLLQAVATNVLGDAVNWRGTTNDLATIYPAGSPQRDALAGLSLAKDYFPHGGVVGAARLTLPAVITDQPPLDKIQTVLDTHANPLDRLTTAMDLIQNYVLRFNTNGTLAFYVPAPNPPVFYDASGALLGQAQLQSLAQSLHPQDILDSIKSFNVANLKTDSLYPAEQGFIKGYLDGQLLGVPILHAEILGLPADTNRSEAFLSITAGIPDGSWLKNFVTQASLDFDLRGVPAQPIDQRFADLLAQMQSALDTNASQAALGQLADDAMTALVGDMPKVRLTADLAAGLQMPAPIADLLAFSGGAQLHAFSVRYDPTYQTDDAGPLAAVQREGGIAFQGSLNLVANGSTLANIPNAELSVVPNGAALPVVTGRFNVASLTLPGVQINNTLVDFSSAPNPHFSGQGSIAGLAVGLFGIQPLSGGALTSRVDVARTGPNTASVSLAVSSAKIALPAIYGDTVLIHGATASDPFTFSTTGPWNATLELANGITLGAGGVNLIQMGSAGWLSPISFSGNGTTSGSFSAGFGPGVTLTLFPGNATLQRSVNLASGVNGILTVGSDGAFSLQASLGGAGLSFSGIAVPAGATLVVNNSGANFAWQINNGAATASLTVTTGGGVLFSGSAELPPLNFGVFQITGANGGNLTGSFNNNGFAVSSGARLALLTDWLNNQSLTLNTFTYSNDGSLHISVSSPGQSLLFAGFPFDLTSFAFDRVATNAGGAATLTLAGALRASPDFTGFPAMAFSGSVSLAGAVSLQASAPSANFFGFPVQGLTNTFTLAAGQYLGNLQTSFRLGDNSAPLWNQVGSNWFTGSLGADGSFNLRADAPGLGLSGFSLQDVLFSLSRNGHSAAAATVEGDLNLPGFSPLHLSGGILPSGAILVTPAPPAPAAPLPYPNLNAQMSLTLTNSGLLVSGQLNQAPLPPVTMNGAIFTTGGFSLSGAIGSGGIGGFSIGNGTVHLDRTAGFAGVVSVKADMDVTVPVYGVFHFSGSFTNDGTFALTNTIASPGLSGLPVPGMTGTATFTLSQNGLKLGGALDASSGVLSTVLPSAAVNGVVSITPGGAQTLSATATIKSITNGLFILSPPGGGDFTATLDNAGLHLPAGAVLTYGNLLSAPLPLPEIVITSSGDFSAVVGSPAPLSMTFGGFGFTGVSFTLQRVAGTLSVQNFHAAESLPGLNTVATMTGSWASSGSYLLSGSLGSAINLSGLPVSSLAAGASITNDQTSLRVNGSLGGAIFNSIGSGSVTGQIVVASNGAMTVSSTFTLAPLQLGAFQVDSGGGSFSVTLGNSGITFPAGLRLSFNGVAFISSSLPAFTCGGAGDFSFNSSAKTLRLDGYTNSSASFQLQRASVVTTLTLSSASLSLPGLNTSVSVSGTVSDNGNYLLAGTVGSSFSLPNLPVTTLGAGASLAFARTFGSTSLLLHGAVSGGVLGGNNADAIRLVSAVASLGVGSDGSLSLSGNVQVLPFSAGAFTVEGPGNNANITASFNNAYLTLSGARLRAAVAGLFNAAIALPAIQIPANGQFALPVSLPSLSVEGFPFKTVSLTLNRRAPFSGVQYLDLSSFAGSLNLPGFAQPFSGGTVSSNGLPSLIWTGSLTMGGFSAASGSLQLVGPVLTAGGGFDIRVQGNSLGSISFAGHVATDGSFSLTPNAGWWLNFIGLDAGSASFRTVGDAGGAFVTLTGAGISGSDAIEYGNHNFPITISSCTASGISFSGSQGLNSGGLYRFFDFKPDPPAACGVLPPAPAAEQGDVYGGLDVTVSLSANSSGGSFHASVGGRFGFWIVTTKSDPTCTTTETCGFNDCCLRTRYCADIRTTFDTLPDNQILTVPTTGIDSSGYVNVSQNEGGQNGFPFHLW